MNFFVGLDWASQAHAVCVLDVAGQVCWQGSVEHSAEGLAELRRRLARFGPPASLPIAIERPSGLVVDTLMDAGHPVVPIHPNALKASRPRYSAAGSKSDPGDADRKSTRLNSSHGYISYAVFCLKKQNSPTQPLSG